MSLVQGRHYQFSILTIKCNIFCSIECLTFRGKGEWSTVGFLKKQTEESKYLRERMVFTFGGNLFFFSCSFGMIKLVIRLLYSRRPILGEQTEVKSD